MGKPETIAWRTDLSVDDCLRRLREETDIGKRTIFALSGYKGSKPVLSRFDGNRFKLWKRRYYHNSFAPFFFGTLSKVDRSTCIQGHFGMDSWVKVFMSIWLGLVTIVWVSLLIAIPRGQASGDPMVGILVPPGMIFFGLLLPKVGQLIGRGEEHYLREFLQSTLAARPDETGFSLSAEAIENKPL